ncbi:MAG: hypothetical protein IKU31_02510 [Oscillospiraceae bacterium]|nr:hypothetical protein [Oscillospiraceae bacterium]
MKKSHNLLISVLFCAFLGGIAIASLLLPDKNFSEMENRNLRLMPELTFIKFTSGRYMTEAESYISDQIALRDGWVALKALGELVSGKQENNGVYFAAGDTLIRRVEEPDPVLAEENIGYLRDFSDRAEVPVYFGLIPTAASVWQDKLPDGAPSADEKAWTESLYARSGAKTIDIAAALKAHSDEEIYYRTDHHWTSLGAFYGANAILKTLGLEDLEISDYTPKAVSDSFLGTNFSSVNSWWTEPDIITAYVPEEGREVVSNFTGRDEPGRLYVAEQLDVKNKYAYFLGGNQPLCVIRSQVDGPKILVIRDSYSDCLAPFLSERFSEVHLFDLRYNRLSPAEYAGEHEIDMVLILYSFDTYVTDENQFILAR